MRAKSLGAATDGGSNAHGVLDINVFALHIWPAEPVDGLAGSRLLERILQRADVHLGSIEIGQVQDRAAGLTQDVFGLAPVAHPSRTAAARMALVHFRSYLRIIRPIARHLHAARLGVP